MGSPKALCNWGGSTFLQAVVAYLRDGGVREIGIVLGAAEKEIREHGLPEGVEAWTNPEYKYGQLSSLQVGLRNQKMDVIGAVVALVDHPAVKPDTVRTLIRAIWDFPDRIVKPTYEGRGGHPILIGRKWWGEILSISFYDLDTTHSMIPTLRDILTRYPERILSMETHDPGILLDIDTPEILSRHSS